jgi:hypothetical protein
MAWDSEVAICNGALALLGAESISSLADDAKQAVLCNRWYEQLRDEVLRGYPWNFATRRANLGAPLASNDPRAPVWEWSHGFLLPTDCLRVLETRDQVIFRVEAGVLYSNDSSVYIRYIARIESAAEYDAQFKNALAARLAMALAMPITKSQSMLDAMAALYDRALSDATNTDTQEGTPDEIDSDDLLHVRGGGYSRSRDDWRSW